MNTETLFGFVKTNWRDKDQLKTLIGQNYSGAIDYGNQNRVTFSWGSVPRERAVITLENKIITRVQTWSGLNWSAKYGWGDAFRDTAMETYRNG